MKLVHILLIEDNEGDIVLTQEAFREGRVKNSMSIARDGEEALDFLYKRGRFAQEGTPDLILLDINIPKINGQEILRIIKNDEALKKIPVVMLTTSTHEKDIKDAYVNYVNCYIVKPINLNKFMETIAEIENFWFTLVSIPKP